MLYEWKGVPGWELDPLAVFCGHENKPACTRCRGELRSRKLRERQCILVGSRAHGEGGLAAGVAEVPELHLGRRRNVGEASSVTGVGFPGAGIIEGIQLTAWISPLCLRGNM